MCLNQIPILRVLGERQEGGYDISVFMEEYSLLLVFGTVLLLHGGEVETVSLLNERLI